jgi:LacI family transcriptional regulator
VVLRAGIKLATHSNTFSHVSQGLHRVLRPAGVGTVFLGTEGELDEEEFLRLFERRNPLRGIVIMGEVKPGFIQAVTELQHEVVSVYANYPGLCHSILPNERQAIDLLVTHLTERGHTRFAWLGGNRGLERNRARSEALHEGLRLRGIELPESSLVDMHAGDRQEGYDAAAKLLSRFGRSRLPTAWICHNGLMARGALQFALQHGIAVPDQVSLAACDMSRVCEEIRPYLTSASADPELIGEKAGELLLRADEPHEERVFADLVLPARLVLRDTTGSPPTPQAKTGSGRTARRGK